MESARFRLHNREAEEDYPYRQPRSRVGTMSRDFRMVRHTSSKAIFRGRTVKQP